MTCRICGSDAVAETFAEIDTTRCANCLTVQIGAMPSAEKLASMYTGFGDTYTAGMGAKRFAVEMPKRYRAKVRLIRRFVRRGTLLDVGCADGSFLAHAHGYTRMGCDFTVGSTYPEGITVKKGTLDKPNGLPFPDASFDAVTFWAVIEHVREPRAALLEIRRVLKPGGFLFCDTPLASDDSEMNVAGRSHWFFPLHLHVFSHNSLKRLIREAGFGTSYATPSFERSLARLLMRRGRNWAVGSVYGRLVRWTNPRKWERLRHSYVTPIGDIQLVVARKAVTGLRQEP